MFFKVGDLVTRSSYNNDVIFRIVELDEDIAYLKGLNIRLIADSSVSDLKLVSNAKIDDHEFIDRISSDINLDRNEFFYLPGKVLHFDSDSEYLERCMKFYKKMKIMAYGVNLPEEEVSIEINKYLSQLNPDIVVVTGHDFYYKKSKNSTDNYKNSANFIKSVKAAREYEKSHDKLIIIAGACQSDYEELIRAGANFASSPKRVNLHALDPAIIATSVALSDKSKPIDLLSIIGKTKYKEEGIGGIITNGTMYMGYPR